MTSFVWLVPGRSVMRSFCGRICVTSPVLPLSLSRSSFWIANVLEGNSTAEVLQPPFSRFSFRSQREALDPFPNT